MLCRRCAAGLVDAVQALQQRNRLLQGDLDTLKAKYTGERRKGEGRGVAVWERV